MLARVIGRRGAPRGIRSDNGSAVVCAALTGWLPSQGAEPLPVAPGRPWESGVGESFNSRFRDEFLEREEFADDRDAKEKGDWFRREYTTVRPHRALDDKTPKQFSDACAAGHHGQPFSGNSDLLDPHSRESMRHERSRSATADLDRDRHNG